MPEDEFTRRSKLKDIAAFNREFSSWLDPLRDLDRLLALPVTLIPIVAADNGHGEAVIQSIARSHSRSCVGRPASFSSG